MSNPAPNPARFVAASAIIGAGVPFAATAIAYALVLLVDPPPHPVGAPVVVLALFLALALFVLRLLWPPTASVIELLRQGISPAHFSGFLVTEALLNGLTYAACGALLWYALYRRQWAWLALVGVAILFWLRPSVPPH